MVHHQGGTFGNGIAPVLGAVKACKIAWRRWSCENPAVNKRKYCVPCEQPLFCESSACGGLAKREQGRTWLPEKECVRKMDAMVIGAAFVVSVATAFVVQRAVLGVMFRALLRDKPAEQ